jgi:anaerobic selenocysteine-containing dehydrogenase
MIVKTYCARMDHGGCGILAHVEDRKITKIEGDPDSPINRGTICAKGLAKIEPSLGSLPLRAGLCRVRKANGI